jgi:hypothetical protein
MIVSCIISLKFLNSVRMYPLILLLNFVIINFFPPEINIIYPKKGLEHQRLESSLLMKMAGSCNIDDFAMT